MRIVVIAIGLLLAAPAAAQTPAAAPPAADPRIVVKPAKPSWLSSKPAKAGPTWTPMSQWPMCIAALSEPGEDKAKQIALTNYRALYFQYAAKQTELTTQQADETLKATPKPPAFLAMPCVKEAPLPFDRAFRADHPWATSYFDAVLDREMFTPMATDDPAPATVSVPTTP